MSRSWYADDTDRDDIRKTKRNRQPRCSAILKWKWALPVGDREFQCWSRVEKGQNLCIHCRTGSRKYVERVK